MSVTRKRTTNKKVSSPGSIEDRIRPVAEVDNYLKCLFYGRSGTGKTTIAGSFPTPHLLLDCRDKGTKSVKRVVGMDVLEVESWADFEEVYWLLKNNPDRYKTVTVDTVTQLQELCMAKVKGSSEASKTSRNAWGEVGELMKAWIVRFRDLPMHVIFIAQPRLDTDETESEELAPEVGAGVSPATQKILHAAVDIIGYTCIREVEKKIKLKTGKFRIDQVTEYCVRIGPHPIMTTKFRRDKNIPGNIPELLPDATYEKLVKLTIGEE